MSALHQARLAEDRAAELLAEARVSREVAQLADRKGLALEAAQEQLAQQAARQLSRAAARFARADDERRDALRAVTAAAEKLDRLGWEAGGSPEIERAIRIASEPGFALV